MKEPDPVPVILHRPVYDGTIRIEGPLEARLVPLHLSNGQWVWAITLDENAYSGEVYG